MRKVIPFVVLLLGCASLQAIGAKLSAKPPSNEATPPSSNAQIGGGKHGKAPSIKAGGPDIVGIQLGMTYQQARAALEAHAKSQGIMGGSEGGVRTSVQGKQVSYPATLQWSISGAGSTNEDVSLGFSPGTPSIVIQVTRTNHTPTKVADLYSAIDKKYGPPSFHQEPSSFWAWSTNGKRAPMVALCQSLSFMHSWNMQDRGECPAIDTVLRVQLLQNVSPGVIAGFIFQLNSRSSANMAYAQMTSRQEADKQDKDQAIQKQAKENKTSL